MPRPHNFDSQPHPQPQHKPPPPPALRHHQSSLGTINETEWFFPTDVCSSYSSGLTNLLRSSSMTNSALEVENGALNGVMDGVPPNESSAHHNPRLYHTAPSAEDEEEVEETDDIVVVQPSFDDHGAMSGAPQSPSSTGDKSREQQSRSPREDKKEEEGEELRNPSSPDRSGKVERRGSHGHTRNLSALFGATTISDVMAGPEQSSEEDDPTAAGKKHRRMFSNEASNPNVAHRRLNSVGNAAPVSRRHHTRDNSEGLDILSAAANSTKAEIDGAVAESNPSDSNWGQAHPRPSLGQVSSSSSTYSAAGPTPHPTYSGPTHPPHYQMDPPPPQRSHRPPYSSHRYSHPHYPPTSTASYHQYPPYPPPPNSSYYSHHSYGGSSQHAPPYSSGMYPPRQGDYFKEDPHRRPPPRVHEMEPGRYDHHHNASTSPPPHSAHEWERNPPRRSSSSTGINAVPTSTHQGVQTHVTAVTTGQEKTIVPTMNKPKHAASEPRSSPPVPAEVGHHRKLSSFSSLGSIFGASLLAGPAPPADPAEGAKPKGHHRVTSSTASFLNSLDVGLDDANFLRNLQASNASATTVGFRSSPPPPTGIQRHAGDPMPRSSMPSPHFAEPEMPPADGANKLAAGGTSKRVRRKCTAPGCANRVVQGGLCISHGAKRKTCKHPGCSKNVKKAGLCSTHGPARKRCEHADCPKVAVQGGRCIAHGAKKKLCSVDECTKQAILSGMCKKHHDQSLLGGKSDTFCRPVAQHKPTHTRGLSIFQEMSADTVSSLLNEPSTTAKP